MLCQPPLAKQSRRKLIPSQSHLERRMASLLCYRQRQTPTCCHPSKADSLSLRVSVRITATFICSEAPIWEQHCSRLYTHYDRKQACSYGTPMASLRVPQIMNNDSAPPGRLWKSGGSADKDLLNRRSGSMSAGNANTSQQGNCRVQKQRLKLKR